MKNSNRQNLLFHKNTVIYLAFTNFGYCINTENS